MNACKRCHITTRWYNEHSGLCRKCFEKWQLYESVVRACRKMKGEIIMAQDVEWKKALMKTLDNLFDVAKDLLAQEDFEKLQEEIRY